MITKYDLYILKYKIIRWLEKHEPTFCSDCKSLNFSKDMTDEITLTGYVAKLCKSCHEKWFGNE